MGVEGESVIYVRHVSRHVGGGSAVVERRSRSHVYELIEDVRRDSVPAAMRVAVPFPRSMGSSPPEEDSSRR